MEPSARDILISEVQGGIKTPAAAEAQAAAAGIGPLARIPDPAKFNPLVKPWWTLPMAVAWIGWRTPEKVREYWDEYRSEVWLWSPRYRGGRVLSGDIIGYQLERAAPATKALLRIDSQLTTPRADSLPTPEGAETKLWTALGDNLLRAVGTEIGTARRVEIPADEWADLTWPEGWGNNAMRLTRKDAIDQGYDNVRLRCSELIFLWQPVEPIVDTLPEIVTPSGAGHMTLYQAAQWIATKGGSSTINPMDESVWQESYAALLASVASSDVSVTGERLGERRMIDSHFFVSIAVDYPFVSVPVDLAGTEEVYLSSYPYIDQAYWRNGFDDSLRGRWGIRWSRLMVLKSEVARQWPFHLQTREPARTGAPGRPSSMHLVLAEFQRRCELGIAQRNLRDEAESLRGWLIETHPTGPPLTVKTITNKLRSIHRAHFGPARK